MIILIDNQTIDISEYGLRCLKPQISSPELAHVTDTIEGRDGAIILESSYNPRIISAELFVESKDLTDMYLIQSELNRLFARKLEFYVIFKREPKKRWKVKLNKPFEIEKIGTSRGTIELEFVSFSPFSESVGTTLDAMTVESDKWQVGQGIMLDDVDYSHTTNTFGIYNAGDVEIDPRVFPLSIKFNGDSTNLNIKNITTGDEWSYTGSTISTDTIELNGIRSFKNSESIFKYTNKKLISLAPGWNELQITGATNFSISFDFRFYYL